VESPVSIDNQVEGPQQKVEAHVSMKEYLKQWGPEKNQYTWICEQVESQLPEGELKNAIKASIGERKARLATHGGYESPTLTEDGKKYAFRGFFRRSDNKPTWGYGDSTLESVDEKLHTYGIEAPGADSARNLMEGMIWDWYAFPTPIQAREKGVDTSIILVYKNGPYVLPAKPEDEKVLLFQPRGSETKNKWSEITKDEAVQGGYPTLRDNFLGEIVIHLDKDNNLFSRIFQKKS